MSAPSNPPTLRRIEFERVAVRLGEMWSLHKSGRTLTCVLLNHAIAAWELRLELGTELLRSQACRKEQEVFDTSDDWRKAAELKGWKSDG